MKGRLILIVQLLGTLAILAWLPSNAGKALALIVLWALTFGKLSRGEIVLYVASCVLFTIMDVLTVRAGQFRFNHPDLLGLPWYEPLMWGFYLVHTWRMVNGPIPEKPDWKTWILAVLFAAAFIVVHHPTALFVVTAVVVVMGLALYRERFDWAYVGYMIMIGAAVEYTGVVSGQWRYPTNPPTGVPLWFATMWGGIGLLLRRLVLPLRPFGLGAACENYYLNRPEPTTEDRLTRA